MKFLPPVFFTLFFLVAVFLFGSVEDLEVLNFRTCLKSFQKQSYKSKENHI